MSESKTRELIQQFMQIQWRLMRQTHRNHMAHGFMGNPYRGQGRVLKLLKMQPEISQRDLLELLDMRPQSLGDLLRKLEQKGYITRTPSAQDKRVMMIRLTEKGRNAEVQDDRELGFEALFDCLSDEEQAQLSAYLERILDSWQENEPDASDFREFRHGNGPYWDWRK